MNYKDWIVTKIRNLCWKIIFHFQRNGFIIICILALYAVA